MSKRVPLATLTGGALLLVALVACGQTAGVPAQPASQAEQVAQTAAPEGEATLPPAPTGQQPGSQQAVGTTTAQSTPEEATMATSETNPLPGGQATSEPAPTAPQTMQPAATEPPATQATAQPAPGIPVPEVTVAAVPPQVGNTGEVPTPLLQAMSGDLARRLAVDPGTLAVVSAEFVTWPDGSLGCPQPGMAYQQVLIDGYRVVLSHGDNQYAYHSSVDGNFLLCERARP